MLSTNLKYPTCLYAHKPPHTQPRTSACHLAIGLTRAHTSAVRHGNLSRQLHHRRVAAAPRPTHQARQIIFFGRWFGAQSAPPQPSLFTVCVPRTQAR